MILLTQCSVRSCCPNSGRSTHTLREKRISYFFLIRVIFQEKRIPPVWARLSRLLPLCNLGRADLRRSRSFSRFLSGTTQRALRDTKVQTASIHGVCYTTFLSKSACGKSFPGLCDSPDRIRTLRFSIKKTFFMTVSTT